MKLTKVLSLVLSLCMVLALLPTVDAEAAISSVRLYGADRYETAFKAADELKEVLGVSKFQNIIVASGSSFADALAGSYLASVKNAPILLVRSSTVTAVKNYIKSNLKSGGTVYLLGGTAAVPASTESGLSGFTVKRLGGATRYDTNLLILQEAGIGNKDVIVCTGKNFADSLSASAAGLPILLVKDSFYTNQKDFLKSVSGNFIIVGGQNAVNTTVEKQLKDYGSVKRLAGSTRYDTSVLVAKEFFSNPRTAVLAYAKNFPDGLCGGPLACALGAPLILTDNNKPTAAVTYATGLGIQAGYVLGGTGLISDKVVNTVFVPNAAPFYMTLDSKISGELDIMVWSGDNTYREDIGHQKLAPEKITSQNVAAVYAMAKEFNKLYPNVKINLYAKSDDPDANDTPWAQEQENFKAAHGKYPDIYASDDLVNDVARGMVADLSVYANDPLYKSFNKPVMATMNYYGMQAGLPQFVQPWGIYVNKELANTNNIDIPDPDWDIDEFTDFIISANNETFWGTIGLDQLVSFIGTGTNTVNAQLAAYNGSGDHVNLASEEVISLLNYLPQWAKTEIFTLYTAGSIDDAVMDNGWWWGYRFFCVNNLLTCPGDPWMLNTAAMPQNKDGSWPVNAVESTDWDIYPRPSTNYKGNTVGLILDPMAIHNYAMDDGNPAWSKTEKAQRDLAYAFASFWCGATEAMQARADQQYASNGVLGTALNDSFPLVTGEEFDKQMAIWYSTDSHARYGNAKLMPGFQEVVRLWEEGQIWDISDKTYPYYVYADGTEVRCMNEWLSCYDAAIAGVSVTDKGWVNAVKANLADWSDMANSRFLEARVDLCEGLKTYYSFTNADFQ